MLSRDVSGCCGHSVFANAEDFIIFLICCKKMGNNNNNDKFISNDPFVTMVTTESVGPKNLNGVSFKCIFVSQWSVISISLIGRAIMPRKEWNGWANQK